MESTDALFFLSSIFTQREFNSGVVEWYEPSKHLNYVPEGDWNWILDNFNTEVDFQDLFRFHSGQVVFESSTMFVEVKSVKIPFLITVSQYFVKFGLLIGDKGLSGHEDFFQTEEIPEVPTKEWFLETKRYLEEALSKWLQEVYPDPT
jgi:hypothetical protein